MPMISASTVVVPATMMLLSRARAKLLHRVEHVDVVLERERLRDQRGLEDVGRSAQAELTIIQ